jgi:hypothetical protein
MTQALYAHMNKKKVQMANKHMKKMFNVFSRKGNASQNCTEIPLHPSQLSSRTQTGKNSY